MLRSDLQQTSIPPEGKNVHLVILSLWKLRKAPECALLWIEYKHFPLSYSCQLVHISLKYMTVCSSLLVTCNSTFAEFLHHVFSRTLVDKFQCWLCAFLQQVKEKCLQLSRHQAHGVVWRVNEIKERYDDLRNRKHVPRFYQITPMEVWENEKCCGNTSQ